MPTARMTVQPGQRYRATWSCPADYVSEHVELAYASTAHRAQGRTVDTAHAMVLADHHPRGALRLGHPGPRGQPALRGHPLRPRPADLARRHGEPRPLARCWPPCCSNEGADLAAHEAIRRQHNEAEGMERLSAEYLTLATLAQAERWDALLAGSGLTEAQLEAVRASEAHGPLMASFRDAEARGLDVEAAVPQPGGPAGPWPTPRTWPQCSTAGWTAGPRRPVAGGGPPAISSPG